MTFEIQLYEPNASIFCKVEYSLSGKKIKCEPL